MPGRGQSVSQSDVRGAASERTANMWLISVTPEVFQLETSLLKPCLPEKSPLILVILETSQFSMGPYFERAFAGSSVKA